VCWKKSETRKPELKILKLEEIGAVSMVQVKQSNYLASMSLNPVPKKSRGIK
jgi:hypothetical protein